MNTGQIKDIVITLFFLVLLVGAIILEKKTSKILDDTQAITARLDKFLTEERLKNLENNVNTTALTSQQVANDYGAIAQETVTTLRHTRERSDVAIEGLSTSILSINRTLETVRTVTLPRIHNTADGITESTILISERAALVLDESSALAGSIREKINSPAALATLEGIAKTSQNVAQLTEKANKTADLFNEALPDFFTNTNRMAYHSAGIAEDIHSLTTSASKPKSFRRKLAEFSLGVVFANARSLK